MNKSNIDKEAHHLVDTDSEVSVELIHEDGKYSLKTDLFELVRDFKDHMIATETLGEAFEPEEKYENPDGTPITFDEDYFGNKRGLNVIPGPFDSADFAENIIWED